MRRGCLPFQIRPSSSSDVARFLFPTARRTSKVDSDGMELPVPSEVTVAREAREEEVGSAVAQGEIAPDDPLFPQGEHLLQDLLDRLGQDVRGQALPRQFDIIDAGFPRAAEGGTCRVGTLTRPHPPV